MRIRGRHLKTHEATTLSALSASTKELEAAWKNGHEAGVEEMEDPLMRSYYLMYFAIKNDEPLSEAKIREIWDDAFLTNVMIPYLRHIVGVHESEIEEIEDEYGIGTEEEQVFRDSVHDRLSDQIIAVSKVILILSEWRG